MQSIVAFWEWFKLNWYCLKFGKYEIGRTGAMNTVPNTKNALSQKWIQTIFFTIGNKPNGSLAVGLFDIGIVDLMSSNRADIDFFTNYF